MRQLPSVVAAWDEWDKALLIAAKQLRNDVGPHGQPMSEATDIRGGYIGRGPGTWHYETHVRKDFAEEAIVRARTEREKKYGKDFDLSSDVWTVDKVWNE